MAKAMIRARAWIRRRARTHLDHGAVAHLRSIAVLTPCQQLDRRANEAAGYGCMCERGGRVDRWIMCVKRSV